MAQPNARLETDLEKLGTATREILSLACHLRTMLEAARLACRGLQHHPKCLLCDQMPETIHHLTLGCPFSWQVWHKILSWLSMTCRPPSGEDSLFDWWCAARQSTHKLLHKVLASMTLLTPWMMWKQRNTCVVHLG
jgi:hypothetical protein